MLKYADDFGGNPGKTENTSSMITAFQSHTEKRSEINGYFQCEKKCYYNVYVIASYVV